MSGNVKQKKGKQMSSYSIIDIEGIGKTYAEKLQDAGVRTTKALLDKCADPKGRKALAEATGIDVSKILKWTNMADLMRIKGVGEEYSELLEAVTASRQWQPTSMVGEPGASIAIC
jgi:predicted flap endonuclease-1-like 5' DNA nuclease